MEQETSTTRVTPTDDAGTDHHVVGRGALAAAGVAGLVYFVAIFFSPPDGPSMATATAQQIRDDVAAQGTAIKVATGAGIFALAAALVFLAALVRQVRDRLPGSLLADVVLGAGLLVLVYQWLVITAQALATLLPELIDSDLATVDDSTLQGWYAFNAFTHFLGDLAIVPMAVVMGAFSIASLRGGLLPRWLSWAGLVFSVAGFLGVIGIVGEVSVLYAFWFLALFGYVLWVLGLSITFLVRLRRTRPAVSV